MTRLTEGFAIARRASPSGRVIRGTVAYALGSVLQRAVIVLMLPLFTRILTPAEFGQIGVLTTIAAAISVIVSLGLETAMFRRYRQVKENARKARQVVDTVGGFALFVPLALATVFSLFPARSLAIALDIPLDALRLASLGAALTASATLVPLAVLRAQERHRKYLKLTAIQLVVTVFLTLFLVARLDLGVVGWMLAYALSSLALLASGLVMLNHRWSLDFEPNELRIALGFGLPLIPHALSHWGLSVSDRAILGAYVPAQEVGAYYVAYLLCLPISLVAIATTQAAQPTFAGTDPRATPEAPIRRMVTIQAVLIVWSAVAVALIGPALVLMALPEAYEMAAALIPWLALGTALFGLYLMPMNAITLIAGRTGRVWSISVLAAATNIGLNLALVPSIGTLAAAINTAIGYGLLLLGVVFYMRRVCDPPLPYDARRIALSVALIGIAAFTTSRLTEADSIGGFVTRLAVTFAVAAVLLMGPFRQDTTAAIRAFRSPRAREAT